MNTTGGWNIIKKSPPTSSSSPERWKRAGSRRRSASPSRPGIIRRSGGCSFPSGGGVYRGIRLRASGEGGAGAPRRPAGRRLVRGRRRGRGRTGNGALGGVGLTAKMLKQLLRQGAGGEGGGETAFREDWESGG